MSGVPVGAVVASAVGVGVESPPGLFVGVDVGVAVEVASGVDVAFGVGVEFPPGPE